MLLHSARILNDLLHDFLEVALLDSSAKSSRVLVFRFHIDPRSGLLDLNAFTCYKSKELSIQFITRELFWVYQFVLEFSNWRDHLDEYDDFCSCRL